MDCSPHEYKQLPKKESMHIQQQINIEEVNKFAARMMDHENVAAKRLGCALMLATTMLIRVVSHGSVCRHIWSFQKENLIVRGNTLKIKCVYGADDYEVDFKCHFASKLY